MPVPSVPDGEAIKHNAAISPEKIVYTFMFDPFPYPALLATGLMDPGFQSFAAVAKTAARELFKGVLAMEWPLQVAKHCVNPFELFEQLLCMPPECVFAFIRQRAYGGAQAFL